nr:MAG TPA: hypothetical protein [Caudoviricetes sp.]
MLKYSPLSIVDFRMGDALLVTLPKEQTRILGIVPFLGMV